MRVSCVSTSYVAYPCQGEVLITTYSGQNNTINSLPQFCPPVEECLISRLSGLSCQFDGSNIGMGPFEPVVCQGGYYCPKGGQEKLVCPAGSYCQPGAATPTPCTFASWCPERSTSHMLLIPIVVLVVFDVLFVLGLLLLALRKRHRARSRGHHQPITTKPQLMRAITRTITGSHSIHDNTLDQEMAPTHATYLPRSDTWVGFEAALEMTNQQGKRVADMEKDLTPQLSAFVHSMRKATDAARFGLSFQYSDLSFHPKGSVRPILQNVTGSIERGSLVAVMGGSGAGKSTFVNVLMGKTTNTGGSVMINNVPGKIKRYKKLIGYVPQDDVLLPELTVRENILHSARIRLPRTWSDVDVQAHVTSVIDCLELSHVRDSLVGSVGKPVISGGQRKRVSIGMELAAAPMAIFLDEPTSGLDATAASSIMRTLKAIAKLDISIITIIHQPRMEIFEMLDDLILLANGQIIYEGPEDHVQQFFENVGFQFPPHANFGDVVTDIITGNGREYKPSGDISKEGLVATWASSSQMAVLKDKHASVSSLASLKKDPDMQLALKKRGAPRLKQTWLCLRRAMLQQWRVKESFWFEMIGASLAGFLLGLAQQKRNGVLFRGIYNEPFSSLSAATDVMTVPQLSLLTAVSIGLISGAPGVKVFSEELLLHRREAEAGHSRLAYFLAKVVSVLPRMMLACFHFSTLMLILSVPIIPWGTSFLANLAYFYCVYGLAACVSMVVTREDAPLLATMISLIMGILSGAAPSLAQTNKWHLEPLWRLSPGVWLAELYWGELVEPLRYLYDVDRASSETGFKLDGGWRNLGVLVLIGTVYRLVALALLFAGKKMRM